MVHHRFQLLHRENTGLEFDEALRDPRPLLRGPFRLFVRKRQGHTLRNPFALRCGQAKADLIAFPGNAHPFVFR
ncbi:hypothetical protein D3C76_1741750 [compost metagenome]